jgi:hypothetical protein
MKDIPFDKKYFGIEAGVSCFLAPLCAFELCILLG